MTRHDLEAAGIRRIQIDAAVREGRLIRVRRGPYCTPDVDRDERRAVTIGGQLACVSELRRRGIWVLGDHRLHVQVRPNAARLRAHDDVVIHWVGGETSGSRVSVVEAMTTAFSCLGRREVIASVDSALHSGQLSERDLAGLAARLPVDRSRLLGLTDRRAESGLESIVRTMIVDLGLRVRSQVVFGGVGRVDLLVEERVVVETDGDEFHDAKVTTRDRRRDALLTQRGLSVLHFRYAQVVYELESVARSVVAAVETHRRIHNSGKLAARARSRLRRLDFS